jgi:uncharacterized spore protein YtfJ
VKVDAMMSMIRDSLTVSRVYGEPIERDGVTVIPLPWSPLAAEAGVGMTPMARRARVGALGWRRTRLALT